jgi:hypothetical protein
MKTGSKLPETKNQWINNKNKNSFLLYCEIGSTEPIKSAVSICKIAMTRIPYIFCYRYQCSTDSISFTLKNGTIHYPNLANDDVPFFFFLFSFFLAHAKKFDLASLSHSLFFFIVSSFFFLDNHKKYIYNKS